VQLLGPAPSRYVLLVLDDLDFDLDLDDVHLGGVALPTEVVRCPTTSAAVARLASGRRYSAVISARVAPDVAVAAKRSGVPILTMSASAPAPAAAIAARATPVPRADQAPNLGPAPRLRPAGARPGGGARLVAFCGPGGTGVSVVAAAFASTAGVARVLLADLARRGDQAFLHGVVDPPLGLMDLADAARYRAIAAADVRRHTVALPEGRLLPGLRRPAHWTAVTPAAFDAVLMALLAAHDLVVADVTGDLEGERDTGSVDVEERNHMARRTTASADVVVVVGAPGAHGARRLALVIDELLDHDVDPLRILPLVNRAPPGTALPRLCGLPARAIGLAASDDGLPPAAGMAPVTAAVLELLSAVAVGKREPALTPVIPGSLGCCRA
jgi:MinD-like ATPase involved in chromosome partitioning or flagellar assembly